LDYLVSACHQTRRHCHTNRVGRLEIDYQLKLRRLFHRNVGDFGAAKELDQLSCMKELDQLSCIKSADDLSEARSVGSKGPDWHCVTFLLARTTLINDCFRCHGIVTKHRAEPRSVTASVSRSRFPYRGAER